MYNVAKRTKARKVQQQLDAATVRMINGYSGGNLPNDANAKKAVEMMDRKGRKNGSK